MLKCSRAGGRLVQSPERQIDCNYKNSGCACRFPHRLTSIAWQTAEQTGSRQQNWKIADLPAIAVRYSGIPSGLGVN